MNAGSSFASRTARRGSRSTPPTWKITRPSTESGFAWIWIASPIAALALLVAAFGLIPGECSQGGAAAAAVASRAWSSSTFSSSARGRWAAASRRSSQRPAGACRCTTRSRARPSAASRRCGKSLERLAEKGGAPADEVLARVTPVDDLVDADLMIEAVVEDEDDEGGRLPPRRRDAAAGRDPRVEHVVDPDHVAGRGDEAARTA